MVTRKQVHKKVDAILDNLEGNYETFSEKLEDIMAVGSEKWDSTKDYMYDKVEEAEDWVSDNPKKALGYTLLGGAIVAGLLGMFAGHKCGVRKGQRKKRWF